MDGEITRDEFLTVVEMLDEDQSLTEDERAYAEQQWDDRNEYSDVTIWLTDTISSTAISEEPLETVTVEDMVRLAQQLGAEEDEARALLEAYDQDMDGMLSLIEQD